MDEDMKNIKEAIAKMSAAKQQDTCPSCGYCSHCGRRDTVPYYQPRPYYTGPYWHVPNLNVWCGGGSIPQGPTTGTSTLNC